MHTHTLKCTHMLTHMHTHMHTRIHTHVHTHMHTQVHTQLHSHIHMHTQLHTHTYLHARCFLATGYGVPIPAVYASRPMSFPSPPSSATARAVSTPTLTLI